MVVVRRSHCHFAIIAHAQVFSGRKCSIGGADVSTSHSASKLRLTKPAEQRRTRPVQDHEEHAARIPETGVCVMDLTDLRNAVCACTKLASRDEQPHE
jgi:hypothetical protein